MKFLHVHIHNVNELVPAWAIAPLALARELDRMLDTPEGRTLVPKGDQLFKTLPFWVEVDATVTPATVRIAVPDERVDLRGQLIVTCSSLAHERSQIQLPLNPFLKGYPSLAGTYSLYYHAFQTETPLGYVGLTKQRWYQRFSQHLSAAKAGSPYLFHKAFRDHPDVLLMHKVVFCGFDQEAALQYEEEFVDMFGLYPLGLNMIPGGRAGFAYLGRLGHQARSAEERDAVVEQLATRESIEGRPNPLCAARWESDPDFVERVICGHSGRLTTEQVRQIRLGASLGQPAELLAKVLADGNLRQVKGLLAGRTYARIKQALDG
jgi:hypothetical protein